MLLECTSAICVLELQERGTVTEPPPRVTISGSVSQWEIFDAYQEDFERNVRCMLVLVH